MNGPKGILDVHISKRRQKLAKLFDRILADVLARFLCMKAKIFEKKDLARKKFCTSMGDLAVTEESETWKRSHAFGW